MDLGAWEQRTAEFDGLAYGEGYGYDDEYVDEGFYDDNIAPNINISPEEHQELLFQRALDKIRVARATGKPEVSLTPEELQAYDNKLNGRPAPAARQPAVPQMRPSSSSSLPAGRNVTSVSPARPASGIALASGIGSAPSSVASRPKRSRRSSLFGSSRTKSTEKVFTRKRAPSATRSDVTTQAAIQPVNQAPPGFMVPGPNGQPIYTPINSYNGRVAREAARRYSSPSRPGSRSTSIGSYHAATPPRDMPGGFPTGSPRVTARDSTPPGRRARPVSVSSHHSIPDDPDMQLPPRNRSRSDSMQQGGGMISFPTTGYPYSSEPYSYHVPAVAGPTAPQPQTQSTVSQPQYMGRRVVSGSSADQAFIAVPRRVPVPVRRTDAPVVSSNYSDPAPRSPEEPADGGGVLVDVVPQADGGYQVRSTSGSAVASSSGTSPQGSERRRRSGRSSRRR